MIRVANLTKTYEDGASAVTAVNDVSLEVEPGQIYGILGRSGAGKTTLMRCLTALERPTTGTIQCGRGADHLTGKQPAPRGTGWDDLPALQLFNSGRQPTTSRSRWRYRVLRATNGRPGGRAPGAGGAYDRGTPTSQLSGGAAVGIARAAADRRPFRRGDVGADPSTTEQILITGRDQLQDRGDHSDDHPRGGGIRRICDSAALMEHGRGGVWATRRAVGDPDSRWRTSFASGIRRGQPALLR